MFSFSSRWLGLLLLYGLAADVIAAPASTTRAALEWQALTEQSSALQLPPEWKTQPPTPQQQAAFAGPESARLLKLASTAEDFAGRNPEDANYYAARTKQSEALQAAMRCGSEEAAQKLFALDALRLRDPKLELAQRLDIRSRQIEQQAQREATPAARVNAMVAGARTLAKEFPDRVEPYAIMLQMAEEMPMNVAKPILDELRLGKAPEAVKKSALGMRRRFEALGKPFGLRFKALDGRVVDVEALKGKVVLLDFWATWCPGCVQKMPELKSMYESLRGQPFEIVAINCDTEQEAVEAFVKERSLTWPQYFDGKGWGNEVASYYGLRALPTMWLLDRNGLVRDQHATDHLPEKVQMLLEEKG